MIAQRVIPDFALFSYNAGGSAGAGLFGPIADGDRQVEDHIQKFLGGFGVLAGDINADFQHGPHSARIDRSGDNAGAIGLRSDRRPCPEDSR